MVLVVTVGVSFGIGHGIISSNSKKVRNVVLIVLSDLSLKKGE